MTSRFTLSFSPPRFDDTEKNRQARTLYRVLLFSLGAFTLFGLLFLTLTEIPAVTLGVIGLIDGVILLALALLKRGAVRLASLLFTLLLWLCTTYVIVWVHGSLESPAVETYLLVILVSGLLLPGKLVFAVTGLNFLSLLGIYFADRYGSLPAGMVQLAPYHPLLYHALNFLLAAVLLYMIVEALRQALQSTQRHELALAEKNAELEEARALLEERIAARTAELAARSSEVLRQKRFFQALVDNSPLAIVTLDLEQKIIACNPAFELLFGYPAAEAVGQELDSLITTPAGREAASALTRQVASGQTVHASAERRRRDGSLVWVEVQAVPVIVGGGPLDPLDTPEKAAPEAGPPGGPPGAQQVGVLALYTDITERKHAEEHLEFLATHDPLTVLPNRALFYQRLAHALERAQLSGFYVAVMFLDLDGFKRVNDTLGHAQGDLLIRTAAARLRGHLRKSDLVARLGGDEFAFLFEDIGGREEAARLARKILAALAEPLEVAGGHTSITASIGISLFPGDSASADGLVNSADSAMYRAKELGKNNYQFASVIEPVQG